MKTYTKQLHPRHRHQCYCSRQAGSDYEWIVVYVRYRRYDPRVVRVLDVGPAHIEMEHLDGWTLDNTDQLLSLEVAERRRILNEVFDAYACMLKWSDEAVDERNVWMHNDYYPQNILYTSSGIRILDPEAFDVRPLDPVYNNSRYGKFFETFFHLMSVLSK